MLTGKVIKALSGFYYVKTAQQQIYQCRARGKFRKDKFSPLVGDNVVFQQENQRDGYILKVEERKNTLVRPPIVNIDQAFVLMSTTNPQFSTRLLNRFLTILAFHNISAIIVMTKTDLLTLSTDIIETYQKIGYQVLDAQQDKQQLIALCQDKFSVFCGQSGVGKSTLLNSLIPELTLATSEISKSLGRGKHTTRHVEAYELGTGLIADTPGFSAINFDEISLDNLKYCFLEFRELSEQCKFRECHHYHEPKCAIKLAVENQIIAQQRYEDYLLFYDEIANRKIKY